MPEFAVPLEAFVKKWEDNKFRSLSWILHGRSIRSRMSEVHRRHSVTVDAIGKAMTELEGHAETFKSLHHRCKQGLDSLHQEVSC